MLSLISVLMDRTLLIFWYFWLWYNLCLYLLFIIISLIYFNYLYVVIDLIVLQTNIFCLNIAQIFLYIWLEFGCSLLAFISSFLLFDSSVLRLFFILQKLNLGNIF